ncbi:MAG TPA: glycine cleavage T C-terminal barrel domain-containing protein [Fimbriiglobus sp.]|jgi:folate-binding protein YgfZ
MPADFGDFRSEYQSALTAAAVFDTSAVGKVELAGPDAPKFLHNLCTNDVESLPLGGGCEAYLCDSRAKVQFAIWVYHVRVGDRHAIWVETTAGRNADLVKYLDRYLISEAVEIADVTDRCAQMHLAGPKAADILSAACGGVLPILELFQHMERTIGPAACSVRRHDRLGVPGFDVVCPTDAAGKVWSSLTRAGAVPAGTSAFETLRIEAGTPLFGPDIDANRFVMEVARVERAVSYSKGCFLGQEPIVMARDRAGHINRAFLGMKVLDDGPVTSGTKLFRGDQEVGVITSSTDSPRLGCPVAVGYVRRGHQEKGTTLTAGSQSVEVLGFPPIS